MRLQQTLSRSPLRAIRCRAAIQRRLLSRFAKAKLVRLRPRRRRVRRALMMSALSNAFGPQSYPRKGLAGISSQKAQRLFVELGHALVDGGMRAAFKNQKLTPRDSILERVGEAQRGNGVVATESDLRRGVDACHLGKSIVG